MPQPRLSDEDVRKIAKLSRLELAPDRVEEVRTQLSAVLGYIERLREVNLDGVEPLTHPDAAANRLADDTPGSTLSNESLMRMAPAPAPPFIQVPKVIGDGGGA